MIQNERDCRHEHVLDVARQMLTAARTAPKGKGIDVIEAALVTGEDIKKPVSYTHLICPLSCTVIFYSIIKYGIDIEYIFSGGIFAIFIKLFSGLILIVSSQS